MNNPITPPIQIDAGHWNIVEGILHKYLPKHKVWAFGSRAKWRASKFSDLDLVIETEEKLSSMLLSDIADAFSESLLPWTVDIVDNSACNAEFLQKISKDRVNVWPRPTPATAPNEASA